MLFSTFKNSGFYNRKRIKLTEEQKWWVPNSTPHHMKTRPKEWSGVLLKIVAHGFTGSPEAVLHTFISLT